MTARGLAEVIDIAENDFYLDRFHIVPKLARGGPGARYRNWMRRAGDDNETIYVLTEDQSQRVIGFLLVRPTSPGVMHLSLMAVVSEYRHRRLGAFMLDAAVDETQRGGYQTASCDVSLNILPSVSSVSMLGFRPRSVAMTYHWVHAGQTGTASDGSNVC